MTNHDLPCGATQYRERPLSRSTVLAALAAIAILGILGSLLSPLFLRTHGPGHFPRTDSRNNLRNIVNAAQMYADEHRFYPRSQTGEIVTEDDARAALALLYRAGYLDDPRVFVAWGSGDEPAEPIEDETLRRTTFRLEKHQCSYTWRKRAATVNDDSKTPIAGSRAPAPGAPYPLGGLFVAYKGGNVVFLDEEALRDRRNERVRRAKEALIGWEDVGGWR